MESKDILNALKEYTDICKLIEETEQDIERLRRRKRTCVSDRVKGSMAEFPYIEMHYNVEGTAYTYDDEEMLRKEEKILQERKSKAEKLKLEMETWINAIPPRMQRIIRYRLIKGMSWEQTAEHLGRKSTGDSVRMEFNRFKKNLEKN